jgi:urate oxidase
VLDHTNTGECAATEATQAVAYKTDERILKRWPRISNLSSQFLRGDEMPNAHSLRAFSEAQLTQSCIEQRKNAATRILKTERQNSSSIMM